MSIEERIERDRIVGTVDHALRENREFGRITGAEIIPLFIAISGIITKLMAACNPSGLREVSEQYRNDPGSRWSRRNVKKLARSLRRERKKQVESALRDELNDSAFWTAEAKNALQSAADDQGSLMELHDDLQELGEF